MLTQPVLVDFSSDAMLVIPDRVLLLDGEGATILPTIQEPAEIGIDEQGGVQLSLGLLSEAGITPGAELVAFSDGDGRIVLRRHEDALRDLFEHGHL